MPNSSLINDGSMHEGQSSESFRKRSEQEISKKEQRVPVAAAESSPPVRALRKRHQTLASGVNHAICPLLRECQPEILPSSICFSSSINSNLDNSALDQTS